MSFSKLLGFAGMAVLLACGDAALAQAPNQIPMGAGVGVDRQPPGSRFRNPTYSPPASAQPAPAQPAASPDDRRAVSASCTRQADAKGLHGKARKAFRDKCKRSGGR